MKKTIIGILLIPLFSPCCPSERVNYEGYGRYTLKANCQTVTIDQVVYSLSYLQEQNDFAIADQTLTRGINRKTRPWLYVHSINTEAKSVDVTFDSGSKPEYPLYTGSSASIFDVYSKPWDIKKSTCMAFAEKCWLVSHRWEDHGIYFDLQKELDNFHEWQLISEIFVGNGVEVTVEQINTKISIISYNAEEETATVKFTPL